MPCLAARLGAGLSGWPLFSTALPAEPEGFKGQRLTMFLCKYPVKSVTQHPAKVFVAPGMHLDSLLQKPLMKTRPFQYFFFSNFPSLLKSCGANQCCVSLGHNCPSFILSNIPEPQSGDNRQQWNTHAWEHTRKAGSPTFVSNVNPTMLEAH